MLSAILLTLSFPPYDLWPLIWVGLVPTLVAQYRIMPANLSSLASAVAIGGWLGGYMIPIFGGSGTYMAALPLIITVIILFADKGNRAFHERARYRWFILHGAVTWLASR